MSGFAVVARRLVPAVCLCVAAVLAVCVPAASAQSPVQKAQQATDLQRLESLRACTTIATAQARLACFDRAMAVTANAGLPPQVPAGEPPTQSDLAPDAAMAADKLRASQRAAEPTGFDITIVSVTTSASRPTRFQTDAGDTWVQTSRGMRRYPPTPFVAHIQLRGVGSLWMDLNDGAPAVRVFKPR